MGRRRCRIQDGKRWIDRPTGDSLKKGRWFDEEVMVVRSDDGDQYECWNRSAGSGSECGNTGEVIRTAI